MLINAILKQVMPSRKVVITVENKEDTLVTALSALNLQLIQDLADRDAKIESLQTKIKTLEDNYM